LSKFGRFSRVRFAFYRRFGRYNLLTNWINALENRNSKQITISAEAKENRVFIKISDNGKGIEKEIEDKIFLPFFTTRN